MRNTRFTFSLLLFLPLLAVGCSGQLFKVAPRPVSATTELTATSAPGNIEVSAYAFTDDDRAFTQFGANLPLAGLLAVDIKLVNRTVATLNTKSLRFELRDGSGTKFKQIGAKKALKRLIEYYDMGFYLLAARRRTLADLEALALSSDIPLTAQEERRGMLFFATKRDAASLTGLTLTITSRDKSLPSPVTVRLN